MAHGDPEYPLSVLPRGAQPPGGLEARVRRSLRRRGLLQPRGTGAAWRAAAGIAAVVTALATAYWVGRRVGPDGAPAAPGRQYVLLLYEDAGFQAAQPEGHLVAEYSAWAASLRKTGQLDWGEKLADDELVLQNLEDSVVVESRGARGDIGTLTGFFIIRARSDAEALAIARACPHLKYGGRIALRAIFET